MNNELGPQGLPPIGSAAVPQPRLRRARGWPYVLSIAVLSVLVIGLGAAYAYSTNSADQWRASSDKASRSLASMTTERDGLTTKNTSLADQLRTANGKLTDTTNQLNDANARIRSLANEKAHLGDSTAILAEVVATSQNVSTEMSTCIRDLQKLQTYLVNYTAYEQASLISFVKGVNSACDTAKADSDSLTRTIQALK